MNIYHWVLMGLFGLVFVVNIFDTEKGQEKKEKFSALISAVVMLLVYLSSRP